ncbi:unnamed protein product [Adineta ricciae]|uniref:Uncharacterized protein n=1 Tax=Adineta ricciae TaxID=249248 RepID=A0A814NQ39_ADIRI|nr:unnamed protein product [Adineta ricciae]CAF1095939.1 unnamed protein product [Adineta ricciae]
MFGIRKQQTSSSMTIFFYLFVLLLILNQFLFVRSFRLMNDDFDQDDDDDVRRALRRLLTLENFVSPVEDALYNEQVVALPAESTVQRRFCCMSPLSGRKRSIRDLTRQQMANHNA